MKKFIITSILAVLTASMTLVNAQNPKEYLGLPGDNLNLYAVMKMFQESETIEAFEKNLNDPNSMINNLDLNNDRMVDYITVSDYVDGNVHTIVLRTVLGREDYQDVAVFTVEKFRNGSVQVQLIGDEALYGKNYIIEPTYAETPNPGYIESSGRRAVVSATYNNVAYWPLISYIYLPSYVVWRSTWYWDYYPSYWYSWRPHYWHYYYGYHSNWYPHYYQQYRHWDHYSYVRYNDFYYSSLRRSSPAVVININNGYYKTTYSRPELRRQGETHYSNVQARQRTETANRVAVKNTGAGSSTSSTARVRTTPNTGSGVERNNPAAVRTRTDSPAQVTRSTETTRKVTTAPAERSTSTTVRTRTENQRQVNQNTEPARRVTPAPAERKVSSPSSGQGTSGSAVQNTARVRSSSASAPARSVPSSATVQRTEPARKSAVQSAPAVRTTTQERKSSSDSNNRAGVQRSINNRAPENDRNSRSR